MGRLVLALGLALIALTLPGAAADFTVVQKNRAFSVKELAVKVGDQVTFVNEDDYNHNVFSETQGLAFDLIQKPGARHTVRFAQPGVADVECAIHPVMRLKVRVTP
jgi:plastocyanin